MTICLPCDERRRVGIRVICSRRQTERRSTARSLKRQKNPTKSVCQSLRQCRRGPRVCVFFRPCCFPISFKFSHLNPSARRSHNESRLEHAFTPLPTNDTRPPAAAPTAAARPICAPPSNDVLKTRYPATGWGRKHKQPEKCPPRREKRGRTHKFCV